VSAKIEALLDEKIEGVAITAPIIEGDCCPGQHSTSEQVRAAPQQRRPNKTKTVARNSAATLVMRARAIITKLP